MKVRTRFAPSPTGNMHIGNLRTALYGYLYARKTGGDFVVRIEDTDQARFQEHATDVIFQTLKATGIDYDEGPGKEGNCGPYYQSQRRDIYKKYALQLIEQGDAYYCFCSDEDLEEQRAAAEAKGETFKYPKTCLHMDKEEVKKRLDRGDAYVIRQNTPLDGEISFDDVIFGTITVNCADLDDMILLKSDGLPTYNFANVVDDHLFGITHVMRGSEYLSSTPKYNLLYRAFGWEPPIYVHLPLIMRDATHKLSKRNGDMSFNDLMDNGYLADAVVNYIALLGWNDGTNQEIYTRQELINAFDLSGINKSPSIFDVPKLKWMNGEYIKAMDFEEFFTLAKPWIEKDEELNKYDAKKLARLIQSRIEILSEIPEKLAFLPEVAPHSAEMYCHKKFKLDQNGAKESLIQVRDKYAALENWNEESIHDALISLAQETGKKNGMIMWPARVALCGLESTPGGAVELADILGKEETLKRIDDAIDKYFN